MFKMISNEGQTTTAQMLQSDTCSI